MYWTVRSRLNALVAAEGATLTAGRTILAATVQCASISTGRPARAKESGCLQDVFRMLFWLLRCGVGGSAARRAEVRF